MLPDSGILNPQNVTCQIESTKNQSNLIEIPDNSSNCSAIRVVCLSLIIDVSHNINIL